MKSTAIVAALGIGAVWYVWFNWIAMILQMRGRRRAEQDYMNENVIDWDMRGKRPLPALDIRLKQALYCSTALMLGVFAALFVVLEVA